MALAMQRPGARSVPGCATAYPGAPTGDVRPYEKRTSENPQAEVRIVPSQDACWRELGHIAVTFSKPARKKGAATRFAERASGAPLDRLLEGSLCIAKVKGKR